MVEGFIEQSSIDICLNNGKICVYIWLIEIANLYASYFWNCLYIDHVYIVAINI